MHRRILIVDDDARVRRALCALIGSAPGLSVVAHASSGPPTLRADEQFSPDVVVLDVLLPSLREGLGILNALAAGAAAFVEKYAGPDALLEMLREVPLAPGPGEA